MSCLLLREQTCRAGANIREQAGNIPASQSHKVITWFFSEIARVRLSAGSRAPGCSVPLTSLLVCARGGIPVCFPQFGKLGPLGQHGFARNSSFTVASRTECSVTLKFRPSPDQLAEANFAHRFELTVSVSTGESRSRTP